MTLDLERAMRATSKIPWIPLAALCAATTANLTPREAAACGGTFCDGMVPGPMPVDQTGENVIFVLGGTEVEVHIQISYDPNTNAQQFAWMVPLAAVPEFSVGSQPLFDQVRNGTVPLYDITTTFESCGEQASSSDPSGGSLSDSADPGGTGGVSETDSGGPDVLLQEEVGAFSVVVLQDETLPPIQAWLEDNGYLWDDNAAPILEEYLQEGNVIAAMKLRNGAGVEDIHPITLRYPSNETCFPLRLTRIAAVDDMDIRVFVLANNRAAPTNYRHVLVNPLKLDWINRASNYKEAISQAVDVESADGRAFVTEYAGPSDTISNAGVYDPAWNEQAYVGLDPTLVTQTLNAQGLGACFADFDCQWTHPLIYGLLLEFLPPPDGVDPAAFYADLPSYAADIDPLLWDGGAGFSAALLTRVIEPGLHAVDLLETWPYVTRMYTTISPQEMMEDPIFHQNPDLPPVDRNRTANNYVLCNGDGVVTLPDGREVYVPGAFQWPQIPGENWWAEEVQTVALKGAPMTLVNNTAAIDQKIEEWNLSHGWPRSPEDTGGEPTGGEPTGGEPTGGAPTGSGGSESGATGGQDEGGGCGCRSDVAGAPLLGLLGLLGLRRRRR
jgi:hypothetical protein